MRRNLIVIHTLLAAFFLPMGIMYAITGGLYGLGIKGDYVAAEHQLQLAQPLDTDLASLVTLASEALKVRDLAEPSGGAGVKKGGTSFYLEWTGSGRDVQLHPTADPLIATLKIKEVTPHRYFVQLHKAKGGEAFKWFAAVWMVGLVLLFVTGGVMAFAAKPYRKLAAVRAAAGFAAFFVMAFLS